MSLATSIPGMMLASFMPCRVSSKRPTGVAKKTRFPAATARGPLKVISRTRLTNLGAPPRAIRTRSPLDDDLAAHGPAGHEDDGPGGGGQVDEATGADIVAQSLAPPRDVDVAFLVDLEGAEAGRVEPPVGELEHLGRRDDLPGREGCAEVETRRWHAAERAALDEEGELLVKAGLEEDPAQPLREPRTDVHVIARAHVRDERRRGEPSDGIVDRPAMCGQAREPARELRLLERLADRHVAFRGERRPVVAMRESGGLLGVGMVDDGVHHLGRQEDAVVRLVDDEADVGDHPTTVAPGGTSDLRGLADRRAVLDVDVSLCGRPPVR